MDGLTTYASAEREDTTVKSFCLPDDMGCGVGQEPDSATSCSDCVEGKWSDSTSNAACTSCEAGEIIIIRATGSVSSSEACERCPAGEWSVAGSSTCAVCEEGKWSNTTNNSICTSCEGGKSTNGISGSASCEQCPSGVAFHLSDSKNGDWEDVKLEVKDAVSGEIVGSVGGDEFTEGGEFSKDICYPAGLCLLVQPVGGTTTIEHTWNAQSLDGLTAFSSAELGDEAAKSFCLPFDVECGIGQQPKNESTCADFVEGKWSDTTDNAFCISCGAGESNGISGSSSIKACEQCPSGEWSDAHSVMRILPITKTGASTLPQ